MTIEGVSLIQSSMYFAKRELHRTPIHCSMYLSMIGVNLERIMRPLSFDPNHDHSLEDGTVSIEDNLLQSRSGNKSPRRADCLVHRPDSLRVSVVWLCSTAYQEELRTMRNLKLDVWPVSQIPILPLTGVVGHKERSTAATASSLQDTSERSKFQTGRR